MQFSVSRQLKPSSTAWTGGGGSSAAGPVTLFPAKAHATPYESFSAKVIYGRSLRKKSQEVVKMFSFIEGIVF